MRILFIENRHKTFFFEQIAKNLIDDGHDIHWLIQNKQFSPLEKFQTYTISYPKGKYDNYKKDENVEGAIKSDRQLNHFKKKDSSYFYYYNQKIEDYLKHLQPNFVFGESTAFHELLTISNCKKLNLLYLNPSTCRFPVGRFSFYKYDSLVPYMGSDELLSSQEAIEIIDQIVNRKTAPDYMKPMSISKIKIFKDKIKKTFAYFIGEKYNTPNPLVKYKIEKKKSKVKEKWDHNAETKITVDNNFNILYPLQMQPEANIDVWGKKYRDQKTLILDIAKSLPEKCVLYIKPNPKSKYELSGKLLKAVNETNEIKHLHHSTKMDEILPNIDLVITVTGTIAIECILSNKPVVNLVKTLNNNAVNCKFINTINDELPITINEIKSKSFPTLTQQEKIEFINHLNKTSYKGIISDPYTDSNCISSKNIDNVVNAFRSILKQP